MIPKIIHQIWIGDKEMSDRSAEWYLKWDTEPFSCWMWPEFGFRKHGIDVDAIKKRFWSPASASNYLRLLLVQRFGGIYLDTDCEPIKSLDPLLRHSAFAAEQDPGRLCNAVFGAEPNHPWINWQIERANGLHDPHDAAWGVYTMSEAPKTGLTIIPSHLVYPWRYDDPPEKRVPHTESLLAHHWEGSWTKK